MTRKTEPARVRGAKARATTAIGKLIGDDAAIRDGRAEQDAAEASAGKIIKKEQE